MEFAKTRTFRIIVIIKMLAVITAFLVYSKSIYFGDVISSAADNPKKDDAPIEQATDKDGKSSVDQTIAANTSAQDGSKQDNKRRSFLDDLLDLPKIDPSTAKKDEVGRYLALAEQKQRQIEDRTRLIQERETNLVRLEKSIEQKLAALQEERRFFAQTIQTEKDAQKERLDKLILLYAKMEPKKAAPIFESMDKDLVVGIFKALPEKTVTKFLEAMTPDRSVALSEYFGRIRSGKEYELLKEVNSSLVKEFQECKGMPEMVAH